MKFFKSLLYEESVYTNDKNLNYEALAKKWNESPMIGTGEIQKKLPGHLKHNYNQYKKKMNIHRTLKAHTAVIANEE